MLGDGAIFSAILSKPIGKKELLACLARLGFLLDPHATTTSTSQIVSGADPNPNVNANPTQHATEAQTHTHTKPRTPGTVQPEGFLHALDNERLDVFSPGSADQEGGLTAPRADCKPERDTSIAFERVKEKHTQQRKGQNIVLESA